MTQLGSFQVEPAFPVALYTETSARCACGATITLRTDGFWWHGPAIGMYCLERHRYGS